MHRRQQPRSAPVAPPTQPTLAKNTSTTAYRPTVPMVRGPDGRLQRASTSAEHIGPRVHDSTGGGAGGEVVRVGAIIHYGSGGGTRTIRFRWPASISEAQALAEVLKTQTDKEHAEIAGVVFSQGSDRASRIAWLDEPPLGHYYFNQELYGENGSQRHANLNNINLDYCPDIPGIVYNGDIAGYAQPAEARGVGGGGGGGYVDPRQFQQQQSQYVVPAFMQRGGGGWQQQQQQQRNPAPVYNPDEFSAMPQAMPQYRY